jgi:hypothetical protein
MPLILTIWAPTQARRDESEAFRVRFFRMPQCEYALKIGGLQRVRIPPVPSVAPPEAIRAMKEATNSWTYFA